uniref:RNA-binding Raly-like protein n=1 Tax=Knipowitschia caucasica TaxID=637954 RepID=A0AAV2KQ20_KNICA
MAVRPPDGTVNLNRVSEYQRVPGAQEPSPAKRQRASPSSSHSSSSRTAHRRNGRVLDKPRSSSTSKTPNKTLKMTELLSIKRELTGIKVQIDELLDCVDKMDQQRKDCPERPMGRETSPHRGSVSSVERDSPEPGEASEEEAAYYHYYNTHTYSDRISPHSLDPEDDL